MLCPRSVTRQVFAGTLRASGLLPVAKHLDRGRPDILRVLLFHRVAELAGLYGDPGLISATPSMFAKQMDYVARHYQPVDAHRVLEAVRHHGNLPPRAVLVTFDDGYTDFWANAWPILQARGVPAVLFLPTAFPDSGRRFWWDLVHETIAHTKERNVTVPGAGAFSLHTPQQRWLAIQRVASDLVQRRPDEIDSIVLHLQAQLGVPPLGPAPVMTWEQLRRLACEGLTIASHTRNHPAVPTLTSAEICEELRAARTDLEREIGEACPLFAFPFGQSAPHALPLLRSQGVVASFTAFTPTPLLNDVRRVDPLLLRREAVNGTTSFVEFCLSLTSLYTSIQSKPFVRGWRRRVRRWTGPPASS